MTDSKTKCPVCDADESVKLYPDYRGRCVSTQTTFFDDIELDNRCCKSCGLIFNAKGLRHKEEEFFTGEPLKRKPQLLSFSKNVKTTQQRGMEVFTKMVEIPDTGKLLDFGAGPGSFLMLFHDMFPQWELSAIEPREDFPELVKSIPVKRIYNVPYFEVDSSDRFDMIVVMSVLEHLPEPLHALNWIHSRLEKGGLVLMRHPNFATLPGDLFTPDHLNKMTIPHTRQLVEHAGFEIIGADEHTTLFYFVLKKHETSLRPLPDCFEENLAIARRAEHVVEQTIAAVEKAVSGAGQKGRKAAVFGISPIASMAHLILECREDIACFVDENKNAWGRFIDGIPVIGPEKMSEFNVSDLALAISPLYWDIVEKKMSGYGVDVHKPHVEN